MNGDSYRLAHSKRSRRSRVDQCAKLPLQIDMLPAVMMDFCSGPPMQNHCGVDSLSGRSARRGICAGLFATEPRQAHYTANRCVLDALV